MTDEEFYRPCAATTLKGKPCSKMVGRGWTYCGSHRGLRTPETDPMAFGLVSPVDPLPDMLPRDECVWCRKPAAEHRGWLETGHDFKAPEPLPNPVKVVKAHIETSWTCWACNADNDVWGVGSGWIECGSCGYNCYLGA